MNYWNETGTNNMLTIAIDFDETLTRDAVLWTAFIGVAQAIGHKVIVVTCRRNTDENKGTIHEWMDCNIGQRLLLYFTNLGSKIEYMKKLGVKVDIWIDDDPGCIIHGK
jgi:hypothetical protein